MTAPRPIHPLDHVPHVEVEVPGSKSLTNRALVAAAMARGTSTLSGLLLADDTWAMLEGLRSVGLGVEVDPAGPRAVVTGGAGRIPARRARIDVRLSGTTARFLAPMLALGEGVYELDGQPSFRARPMGPLLHALAALGVEIEDLAAPGHLPVRLRTRGISAREVEVAGDVSSQFLSGLLLVGPATPQGLTVTCTSGLVSERYVELTLDVMHRFGAHVERPTPREFVVAPTGYQARDLTIEPDASAASYFLAAAAILGGRVRVQGLTSATRQGDARFGEVLAAMGAEVIVDDRGTEVRGTGHLRGIDVDMGDISDTAQTLAAVAVFADGPTRVSGIGFIRAKETDRIHAVVTELARCGIRAEEHDDGFVVHPGSPRPAVVQTYDDHRMAMSFALLGLRAPGISIAEPECVTKTFPDYFAVLDTL